MVRHVCQRKWWEWHPWFAWRPVRTTDYDASEGSFVCYDWCWWVWVERKYTYGGNQYRLPVGGK
jgi:hypothetical protein